MMRIPFETETFRAHNAIETWPSRLPLRNTQYGVSSGPRNSEKSGF